LIPDVCIIRDVRETQNCNFWEHGAEKTMNKSISDTSHAPCEGVSAARERGLLANTRRSVAYETA
jgi:hypothetical protein